MERKGKERNKKRIKQHAHFDARSHLLSLGVDDAIATDWLTLRSRKRAPPTATAIAGIAREAAKAGLSLAEALRLCCERDWRGFDAAWLDRGPQRGQVPQREARSRPGVPLASLDAGALDAIARELGIAAARPGESLAAFVGRIETARNGLH